MNKIYYQEKNKIINALKKIIGRYIRFSDEEKIYMIKALLKIRNLNNNKVLAEGLKNKDINQINSISQNDKNDKIDINQINSGDIEVIEKCIFGQISNFAL